MGEEHPQIVRLDTEEELQKQPSFSLSNHDITKYSSGDN